MAEFESGSGSRREDGHVAAWARRHVDQISTRFLGDRATIELCLAALLCRGHVLIEDVPGVGKTALAHALAASIGGRFRRVQCTPDLLPGDILGVSIFHPASGSFRFREGPIMTNTLLVDEINRATPRTQSALLEAMAEGQVSVESRTVRLPSPFFLVATQSPLESEGTFPLPEVQKDRFFLSLTLGYPKRVDEELIMAGDWETSSTTLESESEEASDSELAGMQEQVARTYVSDTLRDYVLAIVARTREDRRLVVGVSPRGSLALYKGSQALAAMSAREWVAPEDVKRIASPVLAARILVKPEYAARGLTPAMIVEELLSTVAVPGYDGEN